MVSFEFFCKELLELIHPFIVIPLQCFQVHSEANPLQQAIAGLLDTTIIEDIRFKIHEHEITLTNRIKTK